MFTSASNRGSATERRTSICAARWQSTSKRSVSTSRAASGERMSATTSRTPGPMVLPPAGGEIVQRPDLVPRGDEGVRHVAADEAGASGDQDLHRAGSPRPTRARPGDARK